MSLLSVAISGHVKQLCVCVCVCVNCMSVIVCMLDALIMVSDLVCVFGSFTGRLCIVWRGKCVFVCL